MIFTLCFVKTTLQSLSHSLPTETSDSFFKFGIINAVRADLSIAWCKLNVPLFVAVTMLLSGSVADGPKVNVFTLDNAC